MGIARNVAYLSGSVLGLAAVSVAALVGYVYLTGPASLRFPDAPMPEVTASTDPAVIERGRWLFNGPMHCTACHGEAPANVDTPEVLLGDHPPSGGYEIEPPFGTFRPGNLTSDVETGLGAWTDAEIARTVRTGVRKNGELSVFMKLAVAECSDEDLVALVSYIRTIPPVSKKIPESEPNFIGYAFSTFVGFEPRPLVDVPHPADVEGPTVEEGKYLAQIALCEGCHTPEEPGTFKRVPGQAFGGGHAMADHHDPAKELAPPNLSTHPEHGLGGQWTQEQFLARMRAGRVYKGSPMPWENFQRLSDEDLQSIWAYIQSMPPVDRDNGPSYRDAGWTPAEG